MFEDGRMPGRKLVVVLDEEEEGREEGADAGEEDVLNNSEKISASVVSCVGRRRGERRRGDIRGEETCRCTSNCAALTDKLIYYHV